MITNNPQEVYRCVSITILKVKPTNVLSRLLKEANAKRQGKTESHWVQDVLVDWIVIDFKCRCSKAIVPEIDAP